MGRTKALIEIDGRPMASGVVAALSGAGCSRVIAYGGDPDELGSLGIPVLPDRYPGSGPLGGVLGLLERADLTGERDAAVFVIACDLPAVRSGDLQPLVEASRSHPDIDVVVARTSAIEPACAIWRVSALAVVRRAFDRGDRALHVAIGQLASVEVGVDPGALRNINTPDDLARYPGPRDSSGDLGS